MRFLTSLLPAAVTGFVGAALSGLAAAQGAAAPPDPSPSVAVETSELPAFEPTREEATLEAYVDGVVEAHRRQHDTPGVVVSVVRDGRVLFAKGYGYADAPGRKPASGEDTLFRIGSVSKTFTWTAVMMLVDRGLIDLDADVNDYLRDVEIPERFGAPVTMNDLMAHRAGFEDTISVFTHADESDIAFADALSRDMPKRVYPPGARTSYSNWGSALAAKVVEDVSGVPYERFLQEEMLIPLNMTSTTLRAPSIMPADLRARLAAGHKVEAQRGLAQNAMQVGPYAPAGAMASTAADMARWMRFHMSGGALDGVRLMSPQTHALMLSRAFQDREAGADLAHGFMSRLYRGRMVYGHGGAVAAFYADMAMMPEEGVGVFVSQNATNERSLVGELSDLVFDFVIGGKAQKAAPVDADGEQLAAYAGSYLGNRRSFTRFEKAFSLGGVASVTVDPDGFLVLAMGGKARSLTPLGDDVFEDAHGGRIVFGRNASGAVSHFSGAAGVHSYERIGPLQQPGAFFIAFGLAAFFSLSTWLGAWRRQGRSLAERPAGARLSVFAFAAAGAFVLFAASLVWVQAEFASFSVSRFVDYPFASISALRATGYAMFAFAALSVFSLAPAWLASGWSIWRKLHHTLFALSLAFLAVLLVVWNVVFSATA